MGDWELRDPLFLLVAFLAPVVFYLVTRASSTLRYSSLLVVDQAPRSWKVRLVRLPAILLSLAVVFFAIALARPRTPDSETKITRQGISMVMVIDRSGSMQARDLVKDDSSVDRMEVVKDVFRQFVLGEDQAGAGRPDDLIGLIAFARYADSLCPLTLDHGNLASIVGDLQIVTRRDEDGTAIGDALALAVERLRQNKAKSKVIILLTDGVNNAGMIEPGQAAQLAASHEIKVYCIGAGTDGLAPVPVVDPFTGRQVLRAAQVEIDEETLKQIAEKTNGRYFRATDQQALTEIYQEIDRLERTKITEIRYLQYTEHYVKFVLWGLCLVCTATIANGSVFRKLP